jgi:hypothetical protein
MKPLDSTLNHSKHDGVDGNTKEILVQNEIVQDEDFIHPYH